MATWADIFKMFNYAFARNPIEKRGEKYFSGAGVRQPEAIPDIRSDGSYWGGGRGVIRLRDTNDFLDLSTVVNRQARYKEYERLRNVPEIEMVMNIYADEACMAGDTPIPTPLYGEKTLKWLTENVHERFLVYAFDFEKNDYTLAWAFNPRLTKEEETIRVLLDDGSSFYCTKDHRILLRSGMYCFAEDLKEDDELMPFYRIPAKTELTNIKTNQFPRIYTHSKGWMHERQFIDEWRGKKNPKLEKVNQVMRMACAGVSTRECEKLVGYDRKSLRNWLKKEGFTHKELMWLSKKEDRRIVVGVMPHKKIPVYDLSVEKHHNYCTTWGVVHNCQKGENGQVFEIICKNSDIKKELENLFFSRKKLNMNQRKLWNITKETCIEGDWFGEVILDPDNPKKGIIDLMPLPPESMYRIETTKGKLIEFQQGKEGPDYQSLSRVEVTKATEAELQQATAIRFTPEQVIHLRIGEDRKTFYPYGVSLIEPARGPAHQLRLAEDAMIVYRLCLIGDTRIRTKNGYDLLKDIQVGQNVYYRNEHGEIQLTKIINKFIHGEEEVYRVRSKHIEIIGTATHPILVNRKGEIKFVEIKNLNKNDKLLNIKNNKEIDKKIPRIIEEIWAKLSDKQLKEFREKQYKNKSELLRKTYNFNRCKQFLYCKNKALPYKKACEICNIFGLNEKELCLVNKGEINSNRINLPEYVDEEFARLFGFLCGDGCIRKHSVSFCTGTDVDVNNYYCQLLSKYFTNVSFIKDKRRKNGGIYIVHSTIAANIFRKLGYLHIHKKHTRIPNWLFNAPLKIRRAFVEGFSDADGCERFTKKGTWFSTIEIANKNLIEDIKELWSSIGLCSGHIKMRHRNGGHEIEKGRKMPSTTSYSVTISELLLPDSENINSVDYFGKEKVYDIGVDSEEQNFIANGTIVHNSRAPERRVFYIDVGQIPSHKHESFIERMKDQLRKKKVVRSTQEVGASGIDERWAPPSADEDYFIPIRPNSNTRIETLPGAENLGEIDDVVYFRNKVFVALNFPVNYVNETDSSQTRISLSYRDQRFARMIERLQSYVEEDLLYALADIHLRLKGYPEELYEDLIVKMTPPSEWRDLSRSEIINARIGYVTSLKGSQIMSDFDLLVKFMKYSEDEAQEIVARNELQKLKDIKMQIIAQNPQLTGLGMPGNENENEIGIDAAGPNPMLGDEQQNSITQQNPLENPQANQEMPSQENPQQEDDVPTEISFGEPSIEDIKKYDLDIEDYAQEMDQEDIDYSVQD